MQALPKQRQDEVQERNRQVTDGVFAAVRDPKRPRPIPSLEEVPPALNFAPIENAASALTRRPPLSARRRRAGGWPPIWHSFRR
jgi:N-acetylated-alpha-linked acidic dipeptidase